MAGAHGPSLHIMFLLVGFDLSLRTFSPRGHERALGFCPSSRTKNLYSSDPNMRRGSGYFNKGWTRCKTREYLPAAPAKDSVSATDKAINAVLKVHASIAGSQTL